MWKVQMNKSHCWTSSLSLSLSRLLSLRSWLALNRRKWGIGSVWGTPCETLSIGMPPRNWSSSTIYVARRCKWGSFSECNYADGDWQERFLCRREGDAPNHQSRIWQQFGRAGRSVNPEAMVLESRSKRIPPYVRRSPDRPRPVLIVLAGEAEGNQDSDRIQPFICRDQTTNNNFSPSNYK